MNQKSKPAAAPLVKFRTGFSIGKIDRVEVLRETAACVYVSTIGWSKSSERREAKQGEYAQYHDTWSDAHAFLLRKAQSDVNVARRQLELVNGQLGNIKGMKPPREGE